MCYVVGIIYIIYYISEGWGSEYREYPPNREFDFDFAFVSFVRAVRAGGRGGPGRAGRAGRAGNFRNIS